jgi:chromosome segregation ATPase
MKGDSMSEDLTKKLPKSDSENIAVILTTVQNLDTRLTNLESKVEERLHDTRPIWEKVVADISKLQQGQTRLEEDMHDVKISMREITWQIGGIADSYVKVLGKTRELEGRVREVEQQQKPTNSST